MIKYDSNVATLVLYVSRKKSIENIQSNIKKKKTAKNQIFNSITIYIMNQIFNTNFIIKVEILQRSLCNPLYSEFLIKRQDWPKKF